MNVMDLTAKIALDSSQYEQGLKRAKGGLTGLGGTIKKVLAGLAIGATVTKSISAIVDMTKSAVSAFGEYEQLVGGVNKLYGRDEKALEKYADSIYEMGQRGKEVKELQEELIKSGYLDKAGADGIYGPKTKAAFEAYKKGAGDVVTANQKVIDNAWEAYNTVGMSANQYMSSVTGFSASLIKSLNGDTDKAADYADMAMRDIADNANTFGKYTIEELTGVYQALARGNFQTLDNLQLGYAGTKQGMQDLIKEANRLKVANGETADLSIDSYADMVEAIHLVQESMHIAGTTEREAAGTIEGSINSTKAAWQNLLIAFGRGQDIRKAMRSFTSSAKNVIKNIVPVVKNALQGIGEFIGEIGPVLINELPGLISDLLPSMLRAVGNLVISIGRALPSMLKAVWTAANTAISSVNWRETGTQILTTISSAWTALKTWAGGLWEQAKAGIQNINWASVASTVTTAVSSAWSNLKEWAGAIWEKAKTGITSIKWNEIGSKVTTAISSAWSTLSSWASGIWGQVKTAIEGIEWSSVGTTIWGKIKTPFLSIVEWFHERFEQAPDAIKSVDWAQLGTDIWDAIKGAFSAIGDWFNTTFGAAKDGIASDIDWAGLGKSILDTILVAFMSLNTLLYNFFNAAWKDIKAIDWSGLGDKIRGFILDGFEKLGEGMRGKGEEVYNEIAGLDWLQLGADIVAHILYGLVTLPGAIVNIIHDALLAAIGKRDLAENAGYQIEHAMMSSAGFAALPADVRKASIDAIYGVTKTKQAWRDAGEKLEGATAEGISTFPDDAEEVFGEAKDRAAIKWSGAGRDIYRPIEAGVKKATSAISRIQTAINNLKGKRLTITVDAVAGANAGLVPKVTPNARAMDTGRIFKKPTIFGYAEGSYQMAGEVGDEALIGVNSLQSMVRNAARDAVGNMMSELISELHAIHSDMPTGDLVLDTGILAGAMANKMDMALSDIADWRGNKRA